MSRKNLVIITTITISSVLLMILEAAFGTMIGMCTEYLIQKFKKRIFKD